MFIEKHLSITDKIEGEGKVSLAALLVAWLAIPIFLLVYFFTIRLPLRAIANTGLLIIFRIPSIILIIVWICWGVITTKRHFNCELAYTDSHVLGICAGKSIIAEFADVKNVFVGQSIWGKIFHYGDITISAKYASVTFKNIADPQRLKQALMAKTMQAESKI